MRAADTNIVLRYLTRDDSAQAMQARALIEAGGVFISLTVLLETEWALRHFYKIRGGAACQALRGFVRLAGVTMESPLRTEQALDWMEAGMDFADALHLASAEGCDEFVTFDKDFARLGETLSGTKMRLL